MTINKDQLHARYQKYSHAKTLEDFQHNLSIVHERMINACNRVSRDPSTVQLLPVSKTFDEPIFKPVPL